MVKFQEISKPSPLLFLN